MSGAPKTRRRTTVHKLYDGRSSTTTNSRDQLSGWLLISFATYGVCILDIDECAVNNGNCSDYANCMNFQGSYSCTCMTGFTGDGSTCTGVFINKLTIHEKKLEMCGKS